MSAKDDPTQQSDADMAALREKIDRIDAALVDLLAERQACIAAAAGVKARIGWPARIGSRVDEVQQKVTRRANENGLDADLARKLWTAIIEWSIAYEERLMTASGEKRDSA
jgi:isochorismate pyruvate lyase